MIEWPGVNWSPITRSGHSCGPLSVLQPLEWRRNPRLVWVSPSADLFGERVSDGVIDQVFAVMAVCPELTFSIFTKRPDRMRTYVEHVNRWPLPNVWLGVSVEDQGTLDARNPHLLATPATKRVVGYEPALGPIRHWWQRPLGFHPVDCYDALTGRWEADDDETGSSTSMGRGPKIDWVIAGGESDPGARPMQLHWARSVRDQCSEAGVPFYFKGWGEFDTSGKRVGKKRAGRTLDYRTHDEVPE